MFYVLLHGTAVIKLKFLFPNYIIITLIKLSSLYYISIFFVHSGHYLVIHNFFHLRQLNNSAFFPLIFGLFLSLGSNAFTFSTKFVDGYFKIFLNYLFLSFTN